MSQVVESLFRLFHSVCQQEDPGPGGKSKTDAGANPNETAPAPEAHAASYIRGSCECDEVIMSIAGHVSRAMLSRYLPDGQN